MRFLENAAIKPNATCLDSSPALVFKTKNLAPVTLVFTISSDAPSPFIGTWEASFPDMPVVMRLNLTIAGTKLTGAIVAAAQSFPIADGRVEGNTMTFKVTSPDGNRTVSVSGTLTGDTIEFTRDAQVRDSGNLGGAGFFGLAAPRYFTAAKRDERAP